MLDKRFLSIVPIAQASHKKFYPKGAFVSISLAQWADESAYGHSMSGVNNPFGIKATRTQIAEGKARRVITKEFINGRYIVENLYFANYDSIQDSFDAHNTLLSQPHYLRCQQATTPEAYAEALHLCTYATEPSYAHILDVIIKTNNLKQFDIKD